MTSASTVFGGVIAVEAAAISAVAYLTDASIADYRDLGGLALFAALVFTIGAKLVKSSDNQVIATKDNTFALNRLADNIGRLCESVTDNHKESLAATHEVVSTQEERTKAAVAVVREDIQELKNLIEDLRRGNGGKQ